MLPDRIADKEHFTHHDRKSDHKPMDSIVPNQSNRHVEQRLETQKLQNPLDSDILLLCIKYSWNPEQERQSHHGVTDKLQHAQDLF